MTNPASRLSAVPGPPAIPTCRFCHSVRSPVYGCKCKLGEGARSTEMESLSEHLSATRQAIKSLQYLRTHGDWQSDASLELMRELRQREADLLEKVRA